MKYTYAYKTSDGTRHEASMNAESREAVFAALREQGIKAIKVVAADGSKANGEIRGIRKRVLAASVIVAALVAGLAVYFALRTPHPALRAASPALVTLRTKAAAIEERHKAEIVLADGDKARVAATVAATRAEARALFKDILSELKDAGEQIEAKRLYGELMILADHDEVNVE